MELDKGQKLFDEMAKEALEYLLEQFWVLRDKEPDKYQMIREREHVLRTYCLEKLGYRLIVHRYFAKLEKIPAVPESWMGIQMFKQPRDYAIFCCLFAYLEGKAVDEQFLLSDLCEELQGMCPGEERLDWTHYEHRKSLVRVLRFSEEQGVIRVVDGEIEHFSFEENHEVLYEIPLVSRYFMRSYPKDLFQFHTKEEILDAEWLEEGEEQTGTRRRHRVYRKLLLSPVMYSTGAQDADFLYLRNYRNRIQEDLEKHTDYRLELYKNAALLSIPERKMRLNLFPENRGIMDIAIQFAGLVREIRNKEDIPLQYDGTLRLTWIDFERWVSLCKQRFAGGWSKNYREATILTIAQDLYQLLEEWKMATKEPDTGVVVLYPLIARIVGTYPKDFIEQKGEGERD
ncbi:TIGR02678 family protein [Microaerobacter geothermalis]|uniref:TIGR02678 family protein n=1 Tax=Microaerobacter geothermalis TaxID=674972 RepID=UPI001F2D3EC4|nr:TIGR02678 family protein [Microaerobacter geothermalis]MCF6094033.1 TIGR02678 family protein [Microaerobacter geothermalis]